MTIKELKAAILAKSCGGVMYDVTPGSEVRQLVIDNVELSNALAMNIRKDPVENGIDKGVANFIDELLHSEVANV